MFNLTELPETFTGQVRFRSGILGSLILQIEVVEKKMDPTENKLVDVRLWRDARSEDLTRQNLKGAKP